MRVGTVKEVKAQEHRVGLTPESAGELVAHGHDVVVEAGAGSGIGASDDDYRAAGASIAFSGPEVFDRAELIIKVKEPQPSERALLRDDHILFTYLHLAPDPDQTRDLLLSGATCIAYETVTDRAGGLPLLKPMSQVAGRMSVQAGANALETVHGGRGLLLGGVPGVEPGKVLVIGAGVVGLNATQIAVGIGADVTVLDRSVEALERAALQFGARIKTRYANRSALLDCAAEADLIVGAVLVHGAKAPKLLSRDDLASLKPGTVLVDVAIDQGGCFETSRPTTHAEPIYMCEGIVHYAVANMPGAVARTSTYALNNVTLPHAIALADNGWRDALKSDPHLRAGLNVTGGKVTCKAVADDLGYEYVPAEQLLEGAA